MTSLRTPRDADLAAVQNSVLPAGPDERFVGSGVMGLPFASGHYLALRHFPATSFGPRFRALWHRDPLGAWTFYSTAPAQLSCARYFSSATTNEPVRCGIDVAWLSAWSMRVRVDDLLDWQIDMRSTPATRLMSTIGARLPEWAWTNRGVLAALGRAAGPVLGVGRVGLYGIAPNGQYFMTAPARVWAVTGSRALLGGEEFGPIGPLPQQARLGDFWLPQQGIFAAGHAHFETFDASRHRVATGARGTTQTEDKESR
ncbi:MAG: hypothetical protein QOE52_3976 [Mycobacterium sp.]|nr:hypothetical protein [Mycobacterium sp.]